MSKFKAGDVVKRVSGGVSLGVCVGDTRTVKSVNVRGWLDLGGDFGRHGHDPSRYELVKEVDDSTADYLRGIAEFCLGEGVEYDHLDVMQYLEECERWRKEANCFRSDAADALRGFPQRSTDPNRSAPRDVYGEVLQALEELSTLRDRCDELREVEENLVTSLDDSQEQYQLLVEDIRSALAGEVGKGATVEDMLQVLKGLKGVQDANVVRTKHMSLIFDLQEALEVGPGASVEYLLSAVRARTALAKREVQRITKPQYAKDEHQYDQVVTIKVTGNAKIEVE